MDTEIIYSDRKTLCLEVTREGRVIVRAPYGTPMKKISEAVERNKDWILNAIEKARKRAEAHPAHIEEEIRELIRRAKAELPPILEKYAAIMNVKPTHFSVTRATTRFGSCSSKNAVSFSCFLMDYPQEAIEYVVVHELAHIKQHNHSAKFWAEVDKILPDRKEREALLRNK